MSIRYFPYGYRLGWEWNLLTKRFHVRVGRNQVALWNQRGPVFNFLNEA